MDARLWGNYAHDDGPDCQGTILRDISQLYAGVRVGSATSQCSVIVPWDFHLWSSIPAMGIDGIFCAHRGQPDLGYPWDDSRAYILLFGGCVSAHAAGEGKEVAQDSTAVQGPVSIQHSSHCWRGQPSASGLSGSFSCLYTYLFIYI